MAYFRRNVCSKLTLVIVTVLFVTMYLRTQASLESPKSNVGYDLFQASEGVLKQEEMNERTRNMRQFCSQYPTGRQKVLNLHGRLMYISEKFRLSYCRVAKVGSTFWTQAFLTLSGVSNAQGSQQSLFDVPRDESHQAIKQHDELTMHIDDDRIRTTTSFLVARNPYSRLFSSYIDQMYIPNKWDQGTHMLSKTGNKSEVCPNKITFEDFLEAVSRDVMVGKAVDLHWAPIFSICIPCSTKVDFLAKQETFNEDANFLLNVVGVDQQIKDEIDASLQETNKESSVAGLVHTYITKAHDRKKVKKGCMSETALAQRLWSAFQIQGHIHNAVPFPEAKFRGTTEDQTESKLTKRVLDAVKKRPLTAEEKDAQRQQWKVLFWRKITAATLQKVQDAYFEDFMTFGYDLDPHTM